MARIKALATLLTLLLLTGLFPATAAASVWQDISDAQAAEAAGNLSDAVGLYLKLRSTSAPTARRVTRATRLTRSGSSMPAPMLPSCTATPAG